MSGAASLLLVIRAKGPTGAVNALTLEREKSREEEWCSDKRYPVLTKSVRVIELKSCVSTLHACRTTLEEPRGSPEEYHALGKYEFNSARCRPAPWLDIGDLFDDRPSVMQISVDMLAKTKKCRQANLSYAGGPSAA